MTSAIRWQQELPGTTLGGVNESVYDLELHLLQICSAEQSWYTALGRHVCQQSMQATKQCEVNKKALQTV